MLLVTLSSSKFRCRRLDALLRHQCIKACAGYSLFDRNHETDSPRALNPLLIVRDDEDDNSFSTREKMSNQLPAAPPLRGENYPDQLVWKNITVDEIRVAMDKIITDVKLTKFAASMAVEMPPSEKVWLTFDEILSTKTELHSLSVMTSATAVLITASDQLKMRGGLLVTPPLVAKRIVNECNPPHASALNDEIDRSFESNAVEMLARDVQIVLRSNVILNTGDIVKLSDYCKSVLSALTTPVPFLKLQSIWLSVHLLKGTKQVSLCNEMNRRVLESVNSDPSQLKGQERAVLSLFDYMIQTNSKDNFLLKKIFDIMESAGIQIEKYGLQFFRRLIVMDCMSEANLVLDKVLQCPIEITKKSFELTQEARISIHEELVRLGGKRYRNSDLILALLSFGWEKKDQKLYRMIESIEVDVIPCIGQMPVYGVLSILYAYSYSCRSHPGAMKAINGSLKSQIDNLTAIQLEKMLWANARLNNRNGYNKRAGDRLLMLQSKSKGKLNRHDIFRCVRGMWSLAVLENLDLQHYLQMEHLITESMGPGSELLPIATQQLSQILIELRSKCEKAFRDNPSAENHGNLEGIKTKRFFESDRSKIHSTYATVLSLTQKDVSRNLSSLGILHFKEVMIDDVYIADILISHTSAHVYIPSGYKGLIIEVDGPTHYENYQLLPLGPTAMKKRHLQAAGYLVRTLPYWAYTLTSSDALKKKTLLALMKAT